ncbi:hypothetical protein [Methylobacterium sp. B1]|uniref:hypothetical protein n=1 Tax=Methylobacterium sp. B1 TaxID=91459 RepID=UPI000344A26D|nr:hypothetical protein [Methylobacterium sp. B1]
MPALSPDYRKRVRRLRARATRRDIGVLTSRRALSPNHLGGIMLTDIPMNGVIAGGNFDLTIDEAERRVDELVADIEKRSLRFGGSR